MGSFPSREEYEALVYGLAQEHPEIAFSSLHLYSTSRGTGILRGLVRFHSGVELRVFELLDFVAGSIGEYSYDVFRDQEPLRWYDSQPHPENPELASTFPHHRHEPPDLKNNRRPAPGITFDTPNLPTLIADCVELGRVL